MLQDILAGRPTEIEAINGAIVRGGRQLSIPTPYNEVLLSLVRIIDNTAAFPAAQLPGAF